MSKLFCFLMGILMICFSACVYRNIEDINPNSCDLRGQTYTADIQVIIEINCTNPGCHIQDFEFGGVRLDSYDKVLEAVNRPNDVFCKAVQHSTDLPAGKRMPPSGVMDPCSIDKICSWISDGAPE